MRPSLEQKTQRPLRIVFSLLHAGYLRHYAEPIRLLAERGHAVHITFVRFEESDRETVLLKQLLEGYPAVTAGRTPRRARTDPWRGIAWLVRALMDVLRYANPRYADSPALRQRTADKMLMHVAASRNDPITRWITLRALRYISRCPDPARARRYIRILRTTERAVPTDAPINRLLAEPRADAVLASPVVEIGSPQVEFVKSAQRLGIPCGIGVASWDNLTSKGLLRVIPDRVLVWNELQRAELEEMHDIPAERVAITGGPKFDPWFERVPSTTREQFAANVGLDPHRGYLLYLCSSIFIAPDELSFVRRWIGALRSSGDERLRELGVLIRPHPQNPSQWLDPDLSEFRNVVVWPRGGQYPDAGNAQAGFFDSMAHSAVVVGINTSAQIDAAIVGKPVYTVRAFDASQDGTIHFHYLLHENGGFVRDAASLEEHVAQLSAGLADITGRTEEVRAFVESFVRPHGLDRPVAPLVADAIEALARSRPYPVAHARALVLRALLYPIVAAMALGTLPLRAWYWLSLRLRRRRVAEQESAVSVAER